jgi:hypothetical protein
MRLVSQLFLAVMLSASAFPSAQTPNKNAAPSPPPASTDSDEYARGFKAGLAQHQELLQDARDELARVRQEVDGVKVANDRFLALYGVVTLLLLGQGAFSLHKQKSGSKEVQTAAADAIRKAKQAAKNAEESAQKALNLVNDAKVEMGKVFEARRTLFSRLPEYLKETIETTSALNPDNLDPFHQASVNEIDHLTFLGSTSFHFRVPESADELNTYCDCLLITARGHLAQSRPAETLKRIDMFFELTKSPLNEVKNAAKARMYAYRGAANLELLKRVQSEATALNKPETQEKVRRYRKEISESLQKARDLDATGSGSYFYEAFFHSVFPLPPGIVDPKQRTATHIKGQNRAIELYRTLIKDYATLRPSMVGAARLNICCCLRRLADESGDYEALFAELRTLPSESEIRDHNVHDSSSLDQTSEDLWSDMMQDEVFFAKGPSRNWTEPEYKAQWVKILEGKANLTPWRDRYSSFRASSAAMGSWKIKAWEP